MSTVDIDNLPVILISAASAAAATTLISELIDNDITEDYLKDKQSPDRIWRLVNKYYSVNVRVHLLTDNGHLELDLDTIEAHIIYLTKEEVSEGRSVAAAERRAAAGVWRRAAVRLLLLDAAAAPADLLAWRGAARAHLVPLDEAGAGPGEAGAGPGEAGAGPGEAGAGPDEAGAGPDEAPGWPDEAGAARARAALHAHAWRGLQRVDRRPHVALRSNEESSGSSCAGTDDEDEDEDELRAVEHAEAFAAALGALGPALAGRGPSSAGRGPSPAGREPDPAGREPDPRHDRAEALVAAFCRALGYDLDAC